MANTPNQTRPCPRCKTEIDKKATKCPNCHSDLRNWFLRHPFWTIVLVLILLMIGLSSLGGESPTTSSGTNTSGITGNTDQVEEVMPEPAPIELSGTAQQATQKFTLESGLSIIRMTHNGSSNFAIKLLDSNGETVELLVNEIGSFNGAKAAGITKKGEYLLDVSASGNWTVKIEQPRPTTAESKPKTFSGTSQQVSEFIKLDKGLSTFKLKHSGESNFAVLLLNKSGGTEELLVNEIGQFDGSKAVGVSRAGLYLLDISADGDWSITVE